MDTGVHHLVNRCVFIFSSIREIREEPGRLSKTGALLLEKHLRVRTGWAAANDGGGRLAHLIVSHRLWIWQLHIWLVVVHLTG